MVRRARAMAVATTRRSSRRMIRSAALMATSVPDADGQSQIGGTSAGPSFTPSPTIATDRPSAWSRSITATLSAGSAPAMTSSTPIEAPTARAVGSLSPVMRMHARPSCVQGSDGGPAESAARCRPVPSPRPRRRPGRPAPRSVPAAPTPRTGPAARREPGCAPVGEQLGPADRDSWPSTQPRAPRPGSATNSSTGGSARSAPRGGGDRPGHQVLRCLLHRPRPAQHAAAVEAGDCPRRR